MPIYEYYCADCHGVFEMLRPMRDSSVPQPCPACDGVSERMMTTEFSAFTFRDGYPRRLPDRGTYWHMGKEVSKRVTRARPWEHPEIHKQPPPVLPTTEELERFDHVEDLREENHAEQVAKGPIGLNPGQERERADFVKRAQVTGAAKKLRPRKRQGRK